MREKRKIALFILVLVSFFVFSKILSSFLNPPPSTLIRLPGKQAIIGSSEEKVLGEKEELSNSTPTPTSNKLSNPNPSPAPDPTPKPEASPHKLESPTPSPTSSPISISTPTPSPILSPTPFPTPLLSLPNIVILGIYHPGVLEDEYIEFKNEGETAQQVHGWKLYKDCLGTNFVFENELYYFLEPGTTIKVYTKVGDDDEANLIAYMNKDTPIWIFSPPTASLRDQYGRQVTGFNCD